MKEPIVAVLDAVQSSGVMEQISVDRGYVKVSLFLSVQTLQGEKRFRLTFSFDKEDYILGYKPEIEVICPDEWEIKGASFDDAVRGRLRKIVLSRTEG